MKYNFGYKIIKSSMDQAQKNIDDEVIHDVLAVSSNIDQDQTLGQS